jgi:hypothetical protein
MFAVPAGVVALEQSASSSAAAMPEPVQSVTVVEPATGVEQARIEHAATVAPLEPAIVVEHRVRNSVNILSVATPQNDEPGNVLLPSQIAYLDGLQAQRGNLIARGDAFPASNSPDDQAPLAVQVAYFDRLDQTRIAAVRSRQVARIDGSAVVAESSIPGSGETIVVAESSPAR